MRYKIIIRPRFIEELEVEVPVVQDSQGRWYCPDGDYIKVARQKIAEKILHSSLNFEYSDPIEEVGK